MGAFLVLLLLTGLVFERLDWAHPFDRESGISNNRSKIRARVQGCLLGSGRGVSGGLCGVDVHSGVAG